MLLIRIDFRENRDNQFDFLLTECIIKLFPVLFNGNLRAPPAFWVFICTDPDAKRRLQTLLRENPTLPSQSFESKMMTSW